MSEKNDGYKPTIFKEARDTLNGLDLMTRHGGYHYHEIRSPKRWQMRDKIIDELCPGRKCSKCRRIYSSRTRWAIRCTLNEYKRTSTVPLCRSCDRKQQMQITRTTSRYMFDGSKLRETRKKAGITLKAFATACGWTRSYQSRIEVHGKVELSSDAINMIERVLNEHNIKLDASE